MDSWLDILYLVLTVGGGALMGLAGWGIKRFINFLDDKIENEYVSGLLQRLGPVAIGGVREMYTTYVKPLKAAGKWTPEAAAKANADVVEKLKSTVSVKGLVRTLEIFGTGGELNKFLGGLVDDTVTDQKIEGRKAKKLKDPKKP